MGIKITRQPAIPHGTYYWSCPPSNFTSGGPDTDNVTISSNFIGANAADIIFYAPVFLPHGAVVTEAIVLGNAGAGAETWDLRRMSYDGGAGDSMATANINTEDATITNATIDNQNYYYVIGTSSLDTTDSLYGARITYTL